MTLNSDEKQTQIQMLFRQRIRPVCAYLLNVSLVHLRRLKTTAIIIINLFG